MKDWKEILKKAKQSSTNEQVENEKEIVEAFRALWKSRPSEERFAYYLRGLVIFPQFHYIMARNLW